MNRRLQGMVLRGLGLRCAFPLQVLMSCALIVVIALPPLAQARVVPREGEEETQPEPKITIVEDKEETLQIHQINGHIYAIRVIPKQGKPYNLIDTNGTGKFIMNSADRILVPEWVLLTF